MKEIMLTQNKVAIIDDEDFSEVSKKKWWLAGAPTPDKCYALAHIPGGGQISLHRFVMKVGKSPCEVDHINGNPLDNRKSNLRLCSRSDNAKNKKPRGSSKYMGVTLRKRGRWQARININGTQINLGLFVKEREAALAYDKAAKATGNEFYRINFP